MFNQGMCRRRTRSELWLLLLAGFVLVPLTRVTLLNRPNRLVAFLRSIKTHGRIAVIMVNWSFVFDVYVSCREHVSVFGSNKRYAFHPHTWSREQQAAGQKTGCLVLSEWFCRFVFEFGSIFCTVNQVLTISACHPFSYINLLFGERQTKVCFIHTVGE